MRKTASTVLTALLSIILILGSMAARIDKSNPELSGTWLLDTTRSELNNVKNACPKYIKISKLKEIVIITKTPFEGDQQIEKFNVNSQPAEVKASNKGYKKLSVLRYVLDGKGLMVTTDYTVEKDGNNPEWSYQRKEAYTLEKNGSTLVFIDDVKGPKGEETFKGVYTREH